MSDKITLPEQVNAKFPVRYTGWRYNEKLGLWQANLSDIPQNASVPLIFLKDPWGRSLENVKFIDRRGQDGKLDRFVGKVTVEGVSCLLIIRNE